MRLNETLTLRAKDIDFYQYAIVVRQAKGREDQLVTLPQTLVQPLLEKVDPIPFYVG